MIEKKSAKVKFELPLLRVAAIWAMVLDKIHRETHVLPSLIAIPPKLSLSVLGYISLECYERNLCTERGQPCSISSERVSLSGQP